MKKNILVLGATSDMGKSCKESATRGHNIVLAWEEMLVILSFT